MRRRSDWLDLAFQFLSFVLVFLLLSLVSWPILGKLVAAFAFTMLLGWGWTRLRRVLHNRRANPRRVRVIRISDADS
jgi:predicted PurR-regulated permease PerM